MVSDHCSRSSRGNAEMAQHDRVLRPRDAIPHLVRGERYAPEETRWIELHGIRHRRTLDHVQRNVRHAKAGKPRCGNPPVPITAR